MLTNEQLKERLNYLTGSDASVICGFSPYKTKIELWQEKTGKIQQEDISNLNAIEFGNFMESGVANWFSSKSGILLKPKLDTEPMRIHKNEKWMAGNIDYQALNENAGVECKTAGRPGDDWGDGVNLMPEQYLFQCAHYAMVYDFERIYLPVVFSFTRELRWYTYERNNNLESLLLELEHDFWHNHVLKDIPPEPINEKEVRQLYKETKSLPLMATDDIEACLYKMADLDNQIKELEAHKQLQKDKVARFMGQNDTLIDAVGCKLATWKLTKERQYFDKDKLEIENPEIFKKYVYYKDGVRMFRNNVGK